MDSSEARSKYRSEDVVEKLFSSMKSDIGIRSIRAWTDDAVDGVLLVGFLAQAMTSVTRLLRVSIIDGDKIHQGCHAEVDTYGGAQEGRREEIRPFQFHPPPERGRPEMLRPLLGGSDHVNPSISGM